MEYVVQNKWITRNNPNAKPYYLKPINRILFPDGSIELIQLDLQLQKRHNQQLILLKSIKITRLGQLI